MPDVISRYFSADTRNDGEALIDTFGADAVVEDERARHQGKDAILKWWTGAKLASQFIAEPLEVKTSGETVRVLARVSGNFTGSPIMLTHAFVILDDKIQRLEIA